MNLSALLSKNTLQSTGAILAGLVAIFVLSMGTDILLHSAGIYPAFGERMSDPLFVLSTAYRILFGVIGSYFTARLAPSRPMFHALLLGGIGVVISIAGAIAMWEAGPPWYSIAIIAISLPCAWAGGKIEEVYGGTK
ncbi:hypothetical protein CH373_15550 [Leptospira perolatii]|uniref:Uncharacterized protein n=1 Tax=Leptospira perolatii TaxID=2023191 RepID=A0A2M9ZJD2_9LEPT|nr:hypothetical protein [Leptospira perolatii]PJZ68828.1 hypothetical protein CH360_14010 [Leptospira perolatii]PJZ72159.1 hypothetical protein CH373_15550 [Leptospira perolatii]